MNKNIHDLTGRRFGRLIVLELSEEKKKRVHWKCICDCGTLKIVCAGHLTNGNTKSCGCLDIERKKKPRPEMRKNFKLSQTKLYSVWASMKSRCFNPKDKAYDDYGAKGIVVCDDWKNSPESFCDWSVKNGYQDGLTIDRIDSKGNYEPSNCRWVDRFTQNNNISRNRPITFNGETYNMCQWARKIGINKNTLEKRLRSGWSIERALTEPVKKSA